MLLLVFSSLFAISCAQSEGGPTVKRLIAQEPCNKGLDEIQWRRKWVKTLKKETPKGYELCAAGEIGEEGHFLIYSNGSKYCFLSPSYRVNIGHLGEMGEVKVVNVESIRKERCLDCADVKLTIHTIHRTIDTGTHDCGKVTMKYVLHLKNMNKKIKKPEKVYFEFEGFAGDPLPGYSTSHIPKCVKATLFDLNK